MSKHIDSVNLIIEDALQYRQKINSQMGRALTLVVVQLMQCRNYGYWRRRRRSTTKPRGGRTSKTWLLMGVYELDWMVHRKTWSCIYDCTLEPPKAL